MTLRSLLLSTGIRRLGGSREGFRYARADGVRVTRADLRRIMELRIPPGWEEVAIDRRAGGKLQAVGRDAAGRWQYLYRLSHARQRSRAKFDRLIAFGHALPRLRRALARDLARPGLPREKAVACAVAMLGTCALRPGSEIYATKNGSFGLATLRRRHVRVSGTRILLDFRGKHGRRQQHELESPILARILGEMMRQPGHDVFKYLDASGAPRDLRRPHLNAYIKAAMGARFSARDFRTWTGTLLCAGALARADGARSSGPGARAEAPPTAAATRRAIAAAVRKTAAWLGNTPAVCRRSYIHPGVLRAFERGEWVRESRVRPVSLVGGRTGGLDRSEHALLVLLRGPGDTARRRSSTIRPGAARPRLLHAA